MSCRRLKQHDVDGVPCRFVRLLCVHFVEQISDGGAEVSAQLVSHAHRRLHNVLSYDGLLWRSEIRSRTFSVQCTSAFVCVLVQEQQDKTRRVYNSQACTQYPGEWRNTLHTTHNGVKKLAETYVSNVNK